jgi:nitrite reductase/ring-hydroxylating ferredoxin subunit
MIDQAVRAGTLDDLRRDGRRLPTVGSGPVVVFWHEDAAYAIEDRCPHLGFPLHQGTVEAGLVTCHWHHARFDLVSGCTLDMWADDARGFSATVHDGHVFVEPIVEADPVGHLQARLRNGLEESISLVIAKSVLGLLDAGVPAADIVRTGLEFGTTYRGRGWGAGLTVLVAMANLFPHLDEDDRALALIHGLTFVANDTGNQAPRFPVGALPTDAVPIDRLAAWYRRFIETRSSDSAERTLETALRDAGALAPVEAMMFAAVSDHVFIDGGHTIDFTNKAFEAVALVGPDAAGDVLPTLVEQTAGAQRSEEFSEWHYPHDLVALTDQTLARMEPHPGRHAKAPLGGGPDDPAILAWKLLADDPVLVADALVDAWDAHILDLNLGKAIAYAAALRIVRFHTRNDHADWDTVHHSFTAANALHQAMTRHPTPELRRAAVQAALRIYLDRFLNVPAARLPHATTGSIDALNRCFDTQGMVDEAANEAYGFLRAGGSRAELIAALGRALLVEDAGFHWFQTVEAGVRQATAWPEGSEESALILVGVARFLAAHTPTRRELPTVVRIAARLRRGEALYEDEEYEESGSA